MEGTEITTSESISTRANAPAIKIVDRTIKLVAASGMLAILALGTEKIPFHLAGRTAVLQLDPKLFATISKLRMGTFAAFAVRDAKALYEGENRKLDSANLTFDLLFIAQMGLGMTEKFEAATRIVSMGSLTLGIGLMTYSLGKTGQKAWSDRESIGRKDLCGVVENASGLAPLALSSIDEAAPACSIIGSLASLASL